MAILYIEKKLKNSTEWSKRMAQYRCCFCNGKRKRGKADYMIKLGEEVIIIKNVPVLICENCGERFYSLGVSRKMEKIIKAYREGTIPLTASKTILATEIAFSTNMAAFSA